MSAKVVKTMKQKAIKFFYIKNTLIRVVFNGLLYDAFGTHVSGLD